MKTFFKSFFITLLLILILGGSIGGYYYYKTSKDPDVSSLKNLQFLVLGVDSLDSKNAENTRSDTIIIGNFDLEKGKLDLVSIPRDTYAEIRGYKKQKINHSYNYGGSELTLATVNNLLGTDIKYYLTIDYKFVMDVVDSLGGVKVNVPLNMDYEDPTADPPLYIHIKEGEQVLNGTDAVGFLRFRKGYKSGSDLERLGAQQEFMRALFTSLKSGKTIIKAPMLFNAYINDTQNNIPKNYLLKLAMAATKLNMENINAQTLPGYPKYIKKVSYFIVDEDEANNLLTNLGFK